MIAANGKNAEKSNCFVVTATVGDQTHPIVNEFRSFRDHVLSNSKSGNKFIKWYYQNGPSVAKVIDKNNTLRLLSFCCLIFPAYIVVKTYSIVKRTHGA